MTSLCHSSESRVNMSSASKRSNKGGTSSLSDRCSSQYVCEHDETLISSEIKHLINLVWLVETQHDLSYTQAGSR